MTHQDIKCTSTSNTKLNGVTHQDIECTSTSNTKLKDGVTHQDIECISTSNTKLKDGVTHQDIECISTSNTKLKGCTRKELEALIGLLNHACKVVRAGRMEDTTVFNWHVLRVLILCFYYVFLMSLLHLSSSNNQLAQQYNCG